MSSSDSSSWAATIQRLPPPATLGIVCICGLFHFIQVVFSLDLQTFTMCPRLVLYTHEYYRLLTSTLFHVNIMHIGMNILSTSAIGTLLEKQMGTLRLVFSIWWAMLLTSSLYILISWLAYIILGYDQLLYSHAVGFSGVIFHMSVLETYLHPRPSRSLFGFVSVPQTSYPWALLILLQFIMPQISFLGHLAGILTGNLQYFGVLDHTFLMSDAYLIDMENHHFLRPLVTMPTFVPTSQGSNGQYTGRSGGGLVLTTPIRTVCRSVKRLLGVIYKFVADVIETIIVCIFGRGAAANANIRFWERNSQGADWVSQDDLQLGSTISDDTIHSERDSSVSRIV
ncbi:rhomboid family protein [Nitzschia inconspicua]|uniref:Rhomboid family protein n=1 Tax=Nitzschia inconspicua TaxID=303405 RepID=A0A9K3Q429_9STRA|nr:rhomboid family protein [Nitzschia inconspicua]